MGSFSLDDAIVRVWRNLRDSGDTEAEQMLTNTEITDFVGDATRAYSLRRPREVTVDVVADGSAVTSLPAGWVEEFSHVVAIEYPIETSGEPQYVDQREWELYRGTSGRSIRWLYENPTSGESLRITYTALRSFEALAADSTVLDVDYGPVCALATALGAEAIASKYARTMEPILSADTVTYRFKSEEWLKIAARWRQTWDKHAAATKAPASGTVNWDTRLSTGHTHLTHPRYRR